MEKIIELLSIIGFLITIIFFKKEIEEKMKEIDEEKDEIEVSKMLIEIEKMNGIFYAWNKESKEFIVQSNSINDVMDHLIQKFPNKKLIVTKENHGQ